MAHAICKVFVSIIILSKHTYSTNQIFAKFGFHPVFHLQVEKQISKLIYLYQLYNSICNQHSVADVEKLQCCIQQITYILNEKQ